MTATVNGSVHAGIAVCAVLFVVAVLTARWWNTPVRDTAPHDEDTVVTPLGQLAGAWPEPPTGAVVAQAWRWCEECMRTESALLHSDDCWRCGHCMRVTYAGVEAAS